MHSVDSPRNREELKDFGGGNEQPGAIYMPSGNLKTVGTVSYRHYVADVAIFFLLLSKISEWF